MYAFDLTPTVKTPLGRHPEAFLRRRGVRWETALKTAVGIRLHGEIERYWSKAFVTYMYIYHAFAVLQVKELCQYLFLKNK